jgi:hypothetical protein
MIKDLPGKSQKLVTKVFVSLKRAAEKLGKSSNNIVDYFVGTLMILTAIAMLAVVICFVGFCMFFPLIAMLWLASTIGATGGIWWIFLLYGIMWNSSHLS